MAISLRTRRPLLAARRKGAILIMTAVMMPVLIGFVAFAIDVGHLCVVRAQLQNAADAAALAGAAVLPDEIAATASAQEYVEYNSANHWNASTSVVLGNWDPDLQQFFAATNPINAAQVTVNRTAATGNPVPLFFARVFGVNEADSSATAIAQKPLGNGGARFLIDDEMIDSDVPAIEDLAEEMGVDSEDLISDGDGDWFIDLPPGEVLELPTGQVGDEALFDVTHSEFPFSESSSPSLADFLNYTEDSSSWRYDLVPTEMLDPLMGVSRVNDASLYPGFVDANHVHVSPVFPSDVSALNPIGGVPAVNAKGLRRGLLAFKIIGVGTDPDGPGGSELPNLIIEIADPSGISLDSLQSTGGNVSLVQ